MTYLFLGILIGILLMACVYPIFGLLIDWFQAWVMLKVSTVNMRINNLEPEEKNNTIGFSLED